MNKIVVFGINHKTAPIEIREKFFLNPPQQDLLLSELKSNPAVLEAFVLSTCNRTEVYLHTTATPGNMESIIRLISQLKKIELSEQFHRHFYFYENENAVRHLLRVTSGLDSLVLGEKQIIGQVKTSVERARARMMFGSYFNILSNIAIRTAKKAQNETEISYGGSSISWAAITMAENILGTLEEKSILIIGAGKMGELTLDQLKNKGVKNIYLMNRTGEAAQALAETCQGIAVSLLDLKETLSEVDVCICSAGAPHFILDKKTIEKVMMLRNNRRLVLIDISMPRNIDPQAGALDQVVLSHIDHLHMVVGENMRKRQAAVTLVEEIIDRKLTAFYEKINKLENQSPDLYSESLKTL